MARPAAGLQSKQLPGCDSSVESQLRGRNATPAPPVDLGIKSEFCLRGGI